MITFITHGYVLKQSSLGKKGPSGAELSQTEAAAAGVPGVTPNRRLCCLQKVNSMESPKPQASEAAKSGPLAFSTSSPWVRRPRSACREEGERPEDGECCEDGERLREAVRSLKGERRALQAQLQERE